MKKTMILSALFALITLNGAWAEQTLEQRVTALENNALSIPSGLFLNGEFEMRYDSETYDSNIDSRAEFILGLENIVSLLKKNKYLNEFKQPDLRNSGWSK